MARQNTFGTFMQFLRQIIQTWNGSDREKKKKGGKNTQEGIINK